MRLTIEIDDELFHEVERLLGGGSKREVVRRALVAVTRQELARQLVRVRGDGLELGEIPRRRFDGDELEDSDLDAAWEFSR